MSTNEYRNQPAVPQGEPDFWGSGDGCWVRATDKLARPDASRFNIPLYAAPSQPVTLTDEPPQKFVEWLEREMPPETVILNASWWAPRIYGAIIAALREKEGK